MSHDFPMIFSTFPWFSHEFLHFCKIFLWNRHVWWPGPYRLRRKSSWRPAAIVPCRYGCHEENSVLSVVRGWAREIRCTSWKRWLIHVYPIIKWIIDRVATRLLVVQDDDVVNFLTIHSILQDQSIWKCGIHDSMTITTIPHMVAIMEPKKLLATCKFASDHHLLFGTSSSWAFKVLARLELDHRS